MAGGINAKVIPEYQGIIPIKNSIEDTKKDHHKVVQIIHPPSTL